MAILPYLRLDPRYVTDTGIRDDVREALARHIGLDAPARDDGAG